MNNDLQSLEQLIQSDFEEIFTKSCDNYANYITGSGVTKELTGQELKDSIRMDELIEYYSKSMEMKP